MFSDIDILGKELDNDQFRTECVVECITMDIDRLVDSEYTTEAEGSSFFSTIVEKIKKIISTITNGIKNAILKLADHIRKKQLENKYKELSERAKYIEKEYGQALKQSAEWNEYISDKAIEYYDLSTALKSYKTVGDRAVAAFKNLANKSKDGKKITADEVRDIRDKVHDENLKSKDGYKEEVKISSMSAVITAVSTAGVIGGLAAAITGAITGSAGGGLMTGAFVATLGALVTGAVEGAKAITRKEIKPITKAYTTADAEMKESLSLLSQGMSMISSTLAQSETQSYREAITSLSSSLREVEQILNTAERIGKSAIEHRNTGDRLVNDRKNAEQDREMERLKGEVADLRHQQQAQKQKTN
nr:MAG TPA: Inosine-5'-monophosphate dehydrogenase [Caudoviricetes sp.]